MTILIIIYKQIYLFDENKYNGVSWTIASFKYDIFVKFSFHIHVNDTYILTLSWYCYLLIIINNL